MALYRKKPVVIQAVQWRGETLPKFATCAPWLAEAAQKKKLIKEKEYLLVVTLEGTHIADPGDYIIQGVKGELYPCKPDIFAMTYALEET